MDRTTRQILVGFLAALLLAPLLALQAAESPSLVGSFPLGVYWPWERTAGLAKRNGLEKWTFVERCLDDLKARGLDAVVNDDTDHEQTLTVHLLKPHDVREVRTGQVFHRAANNTVKVKLAPGDGTLLEEIPNGEREAGTRK